MLKFTHLYVLDIGYVVLTKFKKYIIYIYISNYIFKVNNSKENILNKITNLD